MHLRLSSRRAAFALSAGLFFSSAAPAQPRVEPAAQAASDPIVVTGTRATRAEISKRAEEFIRRTGIARGTRPTARWFDPVCPEVLGLAEPHAGNVKARIRAAAVSAGLKLAGKSCRPNLLVNFVPNAPRFMTALESRPGQALRDVAGPDRRELITGTKPIRWFYTSEIRSRDGDRPTGATPPGVAICGYYGALPLPDGATNLSQRNSGIISTQSVRALTSATVVIDMKSVEGLPLAAVADYATLVGFAELSPSDPPPSGSILSLFTPGAHARDLTEWDLSLLRTLYRMKMDRHARRHRSALARGLVSEQPSRNAR